MASNKKNKPIPAPAIAPKQKMFTFTLSEQASNVVIQGLAELPFKLSQGVIASIQRQAQQQLAKEQAAAAPKTPAADPKDKKPEN